MESVKLNSPPPILTVKYYDLSLTCVDTQQLQRIPQKGEFIVINGVIYAILGRVYGVDKETTFLIKPIPEQRKSSDLSRIDSIKSPIDTIWSIL